MDAVLVLTTSAMRAPWVRAGSALASGDEASWSMGFVTPC
jgi:hypothetical protein